MNLENTIYSLVSLYPHQKAEPKDHLGTWAGDSINRPRVLFVVVVLGVFFLHTNNFYQRFLDQLVFNFHSFDIIILDL